MEIVSGKWEYVFFYLMCLIPLSLPSSAHPLSRHYLCFIHCFNLCCCCVVLSHHHLCFNRWWWNRFDLYPEKQGNMCLEPYSWSRFSVFNLSDLTIRFEPHRSIWLDFDQIRLNTIHDTNSKNRIIRYNQIYLVTYFRRPEQGCIGSITYKIT